MESSDEPDTPNNGSTVAVYPGELNMALLNQSGLHNHPKGEAVFELAREISRLIGLIDAHEEKNL